jgi:hypothetical protein
VAGVIASADIPTMIANFWFLPHHLLREKVVPDEELAGLEASLPGSPGNGKDGLNEE